MARKVTVFIEDTGINLMVVRGKQVEKWAKLRLEPVDLFIVLIRKAPWSR